MTRKIALITCALAALSLINMANARTSRSVDRSGAHHSGNHNTGTRTMSTPVSVGYSGTHSNNSGTISISHNGGTSSLETGSFFHEGETSITTNYGSTTHTGDSSKDSSVTQHTGSIKAERNDVTLINYHGTTRVLTNSDGTKSVTHSNSFPRDTLRP